MGYNVRNRYGKPVNQYRISFMKNRAQQSLSSSLVLGSVRHGDHRFSYSVIMKFTLLIVTIVISSLICAANCASTKDDFLHLNIQSELDGHEFSFDSSATIMPGGNNIFGAKPSPWEIAAKKMQESMDFFKKMGADMWKGVQTSMQHIANIFS